MGEKDIKEGVFDEATVHRGGPHGRTLCLAALTMLSLCVSAFATEGTTGLSTIVSSLDTITSLCSKVWTMLTSNDYFVLYLGVGLLGVGIGVFARMKRVARR